MGARLLDVHVELQQAVFGVLTRAGGGSGGGKSGGGSSGGKSGGGGISSGGGSSGGYYSSGVGRGGGSFGLGGLIFGVVCLLFILLIVFLVFRAAKRSGASASAVSAGLASAAAAGAASGRGLAGTQLGDDPRAGQVTSRADVDAAIARVHEHDPAFNEADFLSDCNRAFFTIQQAWTERKPEISRQVMHDGIWQQHKFQIDQYVSQNKQNILENLAVQNTRVVSVSTDQSFDTVMVRFFASCADYDVELGGKKPKVVRGDRSVSDWAEDWIFQRKATAVTKPNGGTMAKRCPNCGAPLELDLAGVCRYCRAPVMSGEFDWVLTRIEQLPDYEYAQATLPA
jgi:predicted lipid-binding transport protein (Tim44 family)